MELLNRRISEVYTLQEKPPITIDEARTIYLEEKQHLTTRATLKQIKHSLSILPNCAWNDGNLIRLQILEKTAGNSPDTVHLKVGYIRSFFRWCIENKYTDTNPIIASLSPKKRRNEERSAFTQNELELVLDLARNKDTKLCELIEFLSLTGLRIMEALQIQSDDIDSDFIRIRGKGKYIRHIPYNVLGVGEIVTKMKNTKGRYFNRSYDTYAKILRKIIAILLLPGEFRNFHSIRKYAENYLIKVKGIDVRIVAELLGHTLAVQQKHYYEIMSKSELKKTLETKFSE